MVLVYHDVHKIPGACLRITNTYGPRHQMAHDEYGVLNWFIRKAIDDQVIPVFGDGRILRDFLYVDDLVDCFIETATCDGAYGEVFNVGTGIPINFIDLAQRIVKLAGRGRWPSLNSRRNGERWNRGITIRTFQRSSASSAGSRGPTSMRAFGRRSLFTGSIRRNTGSESSDPI